MRQDSRPGSGRCQLILPHPQLAHIRPLFATFPDAGLLLMTRVDPAVTQETDNVPVYIAVHPPEKLKSFYLIDHQRVLLFQVGSLNALFQIVHGPQMLLPRIVDDRQRDLPFDRIGQLAAFAA